MRAGRFLLGAAAILLLGTTAWNVSAMELQLGATSATTISVPTGQGRLLLAFPSIAELHEEWVTDAHLTIPLNAAPPSDMEIESDALTTSWGAGVSWTSPWQTPGGDLERTLASDGILRAGAPTELTMDVTDIVRAMAAGELAENGFVVLPPDPLRVGFSTEELTLLGGAASAAQLTVHYRKLTGLGYYGGPKALLARRHSARADGAGHAR